MRRSTRRAAFRLPRAVLLLVVTAGCATARRPSSADAAPSVAARAAADSLLARELRALGVADQAARVGFGAAAAAGDTAYLKRLMAGDSARTRRLREIVTAHGWPTPKRVGAQAAQAAWLVLQHGDDVAWQESMLPVLETQARAGAIPFSDVAMLTDRVLVRSGRPQRFGSSFAVTDGRLVAHPIADVARVDERRAAYGLPPMREYVQRLAQAYGLPVEWPPHARE